VPSVCSVSACVSLVMPAQRGGVSGEGAGADWERSGRGGAGTYVALCRALGSEPPPAIVKMCRGGWGVQWVDVWSRR
jgi:hypothetical protein